MDSMSSPLWVQPSAWPESGYGQEEYTPTERSSYYEDAYVHPGLAGDYASVDPYAYLPDLTNSPSISSSDASVYSGPNGRYHGDTGPYLQSSVSRSRSRSQVVDDGKLEDVRGAIANMNLDHDPNYHDSSIDPHDNGSMPPPTWTSRDTASGKASSSKKRTKSSTKEARLAKDTYQDAAYADDSAYESNQVDDTYEVDPGADTDAMFAEAEENVMEGDWRGIRPHATNPNRKSVDVLRRSEAINEKAVAAALKAITTATRSRRPAASSRTGSKHVSSSSSSSSKAHKSSSSHRKSFLFG
ncbi:hypothetical protein B0H66DRAFT_536854 [Apodospora peruviana]|uniref:Uncharacterized protein n=1 Tax=Apodospora peruviana TaxID=516989 RepID=A0AAE0LZR9_9PEZI|nr:hypothetical protein B0H66DRAFT_536854 [Apodospora peruviana]